MILVHKYQRRIDKSGALTVYTQYKHPIYKWKDPEREYRPMNPNTPRAEQSVARTRYNIYHLIRCNQTDHNIFVTLTYAENMQDLKKARHDFKLFVMDLNYHLGIKLKYICIPERQQRGAIHFHALFFNLPYRPLDELKSYWSHGDARYERSRQLRSIASYVSKYVTKNTFDFPKGTRIIMRSRNLLIPIVTIEGLQKWPDVIDYRQPVEVTTGRIKKVIKYDNQGKSTNRRKNKEGL